MANLMRPLILWLCCFWPQVFPGGAPMLAAGLYIKHAPRAASTQKSRSDFLSRNISNADGDPKDVWMPPGARAGDGTNAYRVEQDRHQPTKSEMEEHRRRKGGGPMSFFFAAVFIVFIGSLPVFLAMADDHSTTRMAWIETALLYIWLLGGLYLFTQVLWFQSVHFANGKLQHLTLEESVYLFAQILTTVGYGDITPALPRGQFFVGFFVLIAIFLIVNMISRMNEIFIDRLVKWGKDQGWLEPTPRPPATDRRRSSGGSSSGSPGQKSASPRVSLAEGVDPHFMINRAWSTFTICLATFVSIAALGVIFFSAVERENKTTFQAVYMSLITLSTVGFGAFTPLTHPGMVFGAYWMMCGVTSLAAVVGSYTAFSAATKQYEADVRKWDAAHVDAH